MYLATSALQILEGQSGTQDSLSFVENGLSAEFSEGFTSINRLTNQLEPNDPFEIAKLN